MSISTTATSVQYNGNSSATAFAVSFKFWELEVVLVAANGDETVWTEGTQYTILSSSGNPFGDGNTGTVNVETLPTDYTPVTGSKLRITRKTTRTQLTDWVDGDAFPASATENAHDRSTMIVQELYDRTTRAPLMSEADAQLYPNGFTLPSPEAYKLIAWNGDADDLENADLPTWLTGAGVPSDGNGAAGDMYLNTTTGDVYGPKTTTWGAIVVNISGPEGPPGADGSGTGDVVGPASAVTARIATFNGTTGKLIQDGGSLISDLLAKAGGTMTGKLNTVASATGNAGLNLPAGVAPSAPVDGDVWTTTSTMVVRLNSVSQTFAFLASPAFTGTPTAPTAAVNTNTTQLATTAFVVAELAASGGVPAGVVVPYAGSAAPTGYLLCGGQAVSRATYAALFTAISTTYGVGDGSTTFNLPDLRGRVPVGKDDMNGSDANRMTTGGGGIDGNTLGAVGGTETHTLTTPQIPAHTHLVQGGTSTAASNIGFNYNTNWATDADMNTDSAGGGGAHPNVQPGIILNYIIKT